TTGPVPVEVQRRHTGRRTRTLWQFRECQRGQPASATLTVRRKGLHSCLDYTAGKSGLAPNASSAARCPLLAQSKHFANEFQCLLLGVKRTSGGRTSMSAYDPKRT